MTAADQTRPDQEALRGQGNPEGVPRSNLSLLIAAAGTGGHVFPGLALGRTVTQRVPGATVRFAGTARGIETRAVPEAGFALDLLPILPLSRYVTLPVAVAARLEGVPVVLHEQNAVPGIANRLAARVASRIAVGVAEAAAAFPPGRAVVVGNPVRPELARLDRQRLRPQGLDTYGLDPERRTLFVFGGSQGARRLNQAVVAATAHWPAPEGVQVLHACGRRDEAAVRSAWADADPEGRGLLVRVAPFVERMDLAYAAADLALTRAGAITMAELTAAGVPAVMVPLPHATAGHQAANARAAAAAGGAVVVEDAALDGPTLVGAVAPLLGDPDALDRMAAAMRTLAHPDAAEELAALVVEASGRATREEFLASAAPPVDREATGWFEAVATSGGPKVQRRVDRRSKRMEAYPPIDRSVRPAGSPDATEGAAGKERNGRPGSREVPP